MRASRLLKASGALVFLLILFVSIYISYQAIIVDSDSGYEFSNAQRIALGGEPEPGPMLHQYLFATLLSMSNMDQASILAIQTILLGLIVLVIFKLAESMGDRLTGLMAIVAVLPLSVAFFGSSTLKPYPLFLLFLLLCIYYLHRYSEMGGRKHLLLSSLFLSAAVMTHLLALPFVAIFLLFFVISKMTPQNKLGLNDLLVSYTTIGAFLIPYLAWRASLGDLDFQSLLTYPSSWGIMKYGKLVNTEFWGFSAPFTVEYYVDFAELLVNYAFLLILIPFAGFGLIRSRSKALLTSWFLILLVPYLAGRGVLSWFYMYPFFPLVAVLSAVGVREVVGCRIRKEAIGAIVAVFLIFAFYGLCASVSDYDQRSNRLTDYAFDAAGIESIVPEGSNILFRSRALSNYLPYRTVLMMTDDLSEDDAILFLNWTGDDEVAEIFSSYGISYVIIYKDARYERDYYVWFEIVTGHQPRHYYMIGESEYFTLRYDGTNYLLYEFSAS